MPIFLDFTGFFEVLYISCRDIKIHNDSIYFRKWIIRNSVAEIVFLYTLIKSIPQGGLLKRNIMVD